MRLQATISLYGGGPGSGCNPQAGKCGKTPGASLGSLKGGKLYKAIYQLTGEDRGVGRWSNLHETVNAWGRSNQNAYSQVLMDELGKVIGRRGENYIDPFYQGDKDTGDINVKKAVQDLIAIKPAMEQHAAESGIKQIYRGLAGDVIKDIQKQIQAGKSTIRIPVNTLTSWTANKSKAEGFAKSPNLGPQKGPGAVISQNLNPKDVWMSHHLLNQMGAVARETEFVLGHNRPYIEIPKKNIKLLK